MSREHKISNVQATGRLWLHDKYFTHQKVIYGQEFILKYVISIELYCEATAGETINARGTLKSLNSLASFLRTPRPTRIKIICNTNGQFCCDANGVDRYMTISSAAARRKAPCMQGSSERWLLEWKRVASLHALFALVLSAVGILNFFRCTLFRRCPPSWTSLGIFCS